MDGLEVRVLVEGDESEKWHDYGKQRVSALPAAGQFIEVNEAAGPTLYSVIAVVHRFDGQAQVHVRVAGRTDFILDELRRSGTASFPDDSTRRTWRDLANALNAVTTVRDKVAPASELISEPETHLHEWKALNEGFSRHYDLSEMGVPGLSLEEQAEVASILMMYRHLGNDYEELPNKSGLDPDRLEFPGFDGNTEGQYRLVCFLVEDLGQFHELADKNLNSHRPMLYHYHAMLRRYNALPREFGRNLTKEEIAEVLAAGGQ